MFAVLFEVHPQHGKLDGYLGIAGALRPELERIDGFIDNIRYRSLTRDGWLLSVSSWRDEKALVRWRTVEHHHNAQAKGRDSILLDYHLRVGQLTHDTQLPAGHELSEQRLDETVAGGGTTVTLINAQQPTEALKTAAPEQVAAGLGLVAGAQGLVDWDVYDAVLTPGDTILMAGWRDTAAAAFATEAALPAGARLRRVRVVRDYGMFDRREAPQYYPDVAQPR